MDNPSDPPFPLVNDTPPDSSHPPVVATSELAHQVVIHNMTPLTEAAESSHENDTILTSPMLHPHFNATETLERSRKWKQKGREASLWGFYEHVNGNIFSCVLCKNTSSPQLHGDKKQRKGLATYTSASGTTSLKRHLSVHHTIEFGIHGKAWEEENHARHSKKRKKKGNVPVAFFKTHKQYEPDSVQQRMHDHDLVLLIGKAGLPLSLVENPFFRQYVHGRNPRVKVPGRRKLTDKLIPEFTRNTLANFITPRLTSFVSATITFDLWMSRGTQDIFDLIAHGMDQDFKQQQVHLRMVQCSDTTGGALAEILQSELDKHQLTNKVIACVKDGGSNLAVCTRTISDIVTCDSIGLLTCFQGSCFAHIFSGTCNAALSTSTAQELPLINFVKVRSSLQRCITWTKKSGKGKSEWYSSCRQMNMKERLMPTPVKTRFVSTVVMLRMMLSYRQVVQHCFSNQSSPGLRTRVPSTDTWEIASVVADTLEPIVEATIRSQHKEGWLISDAVADFAKLYLHYQSIYRTLTLEGACATSPISSLEDQLKAYQCSISRVVMQKLEPALRPLREFTNLNDEYCHHYLSLVLDPKYKELKNPYMLLHAADVQKGRELAREYDEELLLPLLLKLKGITPSTGEVDMTEQGSTDGSGASNTMGGNLQNDGIDCFVVEHVTQEEREKGLLRNELLNYRQHVYDGGRSGRSEWLTKHREKYPNITQLARHILAIPATQIDNERVFSLAGRVASPIRSSISTSNIDNLVSIARNYPDVKHSESLQRASVLTLDEFSDYLLGVETECEVEDSSGLSF